jgi:hypothetical protein
LPTICPRVVVLDPTIKVTGLLHAIDPAAVIFCNLREPLASSFQ